jgi:hypothetical protein
LGSMQAYRVNESVEVVAAAVLAHAAADSR